jgi:hypothetical protein
VSAIAGAALELGVEALEIGVAALEIGVAAMELTGVAAAGDGLSLPRHLPESYRGCKRLAADAGQLMPGCRSIMTVADFENERF